MKDAKPYPVDPSYADPPPSEIDFSTCSIVKAVQFGVTKRIIELIEPSDPQVAGYDVNQLDDEDVSLLHWAAINNRLAIARYLLSKGAQIDRPGGRLAATPLHWAIRQSHLSMVHFLMQRGADPTLMDNTGLACIHVAIQMGNIPIIVYLLSHGVNVDVRDANGLTPLMIACMHVRSVDIFRLLISWGADLYLTDPRGNTVAHYAVNFANFQAVMQLDKGGADWNAVNGEGKAAYEVRTVPWLTDRVKQMATGQQMMTSSNRLSRLGCSMLHHSPIWRQRITVSLPPIVLLIFCLLFSWDITSTVYRLNLVEESSHISLWIIYLIKFILFLSVSFTTRFIVDRFSDHKSQATMLFSLATSTTLLLTVTYLFYITLRTPDHWILHFWFLFFITLLWTSFILCCTKDPGYVSDVSKESQQKTILQLLEEALAFSPNDLNLTNDEDYVQKAPSPPPVNPLQRFCTTCFIRKPLRSKHCATCDRCVARFDHHCPWICNCVGMQNHFYFIVYLFSTSISCGLFMLGTITYWQSEFTCLPYWSSSKTAVESDPTSSIVARISCNPWVTFCFVNAAFYCFWTTLLFGSHVYQMIWLNATTNERINIDRYVEFSGGLNLSNNSNTSKSVTANNMTPLSSSATTKYSRPYDHGVWRNLLDLIGLPGFIVNSNKRVDWREIYQIEQINSKSNGFF
ncbi:unnamed protein product [Trichobilharzia szidati]|nr:unnamed protein product [Trichobilharzia szidati]